MSMVGLDRVLKRGHSQTVNTHGHTACLIPSCVSAGIFYSRGKWAVTDITAAHTLNKKAASASMLKTHSRLQSSLSGEKERRNKRRKEQ